MLAQKLHTDNLPNIWPFVKITKYKLTEPIQHKLKLFNIKKNEKHDNSDFVNLQISENSVIVKTV